MKIIDTHTHLYLEQFDDDIDLVFSNARDVGVNKFIFPSIHSKYNDLMINCYNKFNEHCFIMAGYIQPTLMKIMILKFHWFIKI